MTYLESYRELDSIEAIKRKAKDDAWVAMFMGNNPDRMKAIEDAENIAIKEREAIEPTVIERGK